MKKHILLFGVVIFLVFCGCRESEITDPETTTCLPDNSLGDISTRAFNMGFSTWPYGPDESDKSETYQFITQNADIYSEQIDDKIPWSALINDTDLPTEFMEDIDYRRSKMIDGHKLLLSVSLLNSNRSDLLEDYDGSIPSYTALNDQKIEDAYFKHLSYLVSKFDPDYLVFAMEVNDLKIKSEQKWSEYKVLAANIRMRLNSAYPNLEISESVTLHNYFNPEVNNPDAFISEVSSYINQNTDFAAISFYPFFKGLHTSADFQQAFNFLHTQVSQPIAFVETTHLAETLEIESLDLTIPGDVCEQMDYLNVLLLNAHKRNYEFVVWWAYRDFDQLWETFPDEYKDLGKLWRDTGLLDEKGEGRPAYEVWKTMLGK